MKKTNDTPALFALSVFLISMTMCFGIPAIIFSSHVGAFVLTFVTGVWSTFSLITVCALIFDCTS